MNPPEPCVPFTKCWCELHPNNKHCVTNVPINNIELSIIITIGIIFYILIYKKLTE